MKPALVAALFLVFTLSSPVLATSPGPSGSADPSSEPSGSQDVSQPPSEAPSEPASEQPSSETPSETPHRVTATPRRPTLPPSDSLAAVPQSEAPALPAALLVLGIVGLSGLAVTKRRAS